MRMRRRTKQGDVEEGQAPAGDEPSEQPQSADEARADGPWDADEVQLDEDDPSYLHLGALALKAREGVEIRLQADQATEQIQAVMLVAEDGALELRPFAAPRHENIWDEIRTRLAAEATRRGGLAKDVDGPYGAALQMQLPVTTADGRQGTQSSTVHGIAGPRWLLRVSSFGRPAVDYQQDGLLEQVLRDVVVNRGSNAMSPGESLPLVLPVGARRVPPAGSTG